MKPVCPICRKVLPTEDRSAPFPFCSARCKKVDLYGWLNEQYRISEPITPDSMLDQDADDSTPRSEGDN
jgi:uncharacterized protein